MIAIATPADTAAETELLRFSTAGSVDDGKSTLIGRLLHDTKSIFQDQMESIRRVSRRRGEEEVNLALLTDGLRAEREQNITIDVAYRYFATPRRRFIIADTPGHIQYTRNMVTGASTADLTVVLVDARRGVSTQSRRHGLISALLQVPHVVVAVNKMDLVDFDAEVYEEIVAEYRAFAEKLEIRALTFIPVSALRGDNVVERSDRMPWYAGGTLLHHLESVDVAARRNLVDFRFPVQCVIRPHQDFRGLAGRVASGTVTPGEEVVVLPSGRTTRIRAIETPGGPLAETAAGDSVVLTVEDELDISRGDMIVRRANLPQVADRLEATLCWMGEAPLDPAVPYVLLHTTRQVTAFVRRVVYRIDVDTLHRDPVPTLGLNDVGRVQIDTAAPLFFDTYRENRATGSFVLVDPFTNVTVAAGMIRGPVRSAEALLGRAEPAARTAVSPGAVWEPWNIGRERREARQGHRGAVLWFTGLPGAGKSTLAREVEERLFAAGCHTMLLDGDQLRHGLCGDLGFSADDRRENVRRVGEAARLFFESGAIVLCSLVSPSAVDRARVRALFPAGSFLEVHVDCALEECRRRDPKGLYARAARGELAELTGVSAPYDAPDAPELVARTDREDPAELAARVVRHLRAQGIVGPADER